MHDGAGGGSAPEPPPCLGLRPRAPLERFALSVASAGGRPDRHQIKKTNVSNDFLICRIRLKKRSADLFLIQ